MKVDILGTEYEILTKTEEEEPFLRECDGFCDHSRNRIVIIDVEANPDRFEIAAGWYRNKILRHEILHAFLSESGLANNSNQADAWARNEEMVDWIALQFPKIVKVFQEVGCL